MDGFRLTDDQAAILRTSPLMHRESRDGAVEIFYRNLFSRRPDLRSLFADDLTEQTRTFAATLTVMVVSVSDWENFRLVIEAIARRHLQYGVRQEDYDDVRAAFGQTLREVSCSEAQIALWQNLIDAISQHMVAVAYPEPREGPSPFA